ncbi:MAG: DUF4175 family protein [Longimicrobiales bacterium]
MTESAQNERRILDVVRRVRRRWRLRVVLHGLAWTGGLTLAVLLLSAMALERLRFAPEAVVWLRWLTWGTAGASALWFLVRPLARRPSDEQVALYLEEHEPSLDLAVVTALEAARRQDLSPALTRGLVEKALERARDVRFGARVEQSRLYRVGGALTAVAVAALTMSLLAPEHLRLGASALLSPGVDATSVNPYSVAVEPGDATIARGTDQLVTAALGGFDAADASIFTRTGPDGTFQRLSMLPADDGSFEVLLLAVGERTEYFVESSGIRSPTYAIDVADLPFVDAMQLTYRYPSYTGLPPRVVEDGGDVAALPGTVVELRITPTIPAPGGRLVMDDGGATDLTVEDNGILVGSLTVSEEGFYSVELARETGALVPASPEYTIDVLEDRAPSIRFQRPGRDTPASPIEEVYLELAADDDYGVGDLRIVLSVNGGPEDTVSVFQASGAPLSEVSAGHTVFLEEYPLEPGDLVSYYGLVRDNRNRAGGNAVSSDIYFLNIRPFERAYRQGEQQGGQPPQGGGQPGAESALSELQRQIIAATFNLIRQRDTYSDGEFSENVVSVALAQARLREQVQTLLQRMVNRGLTETDPGFRDVSAVLPRAAEAMDTAKTELDAEDLREAMPHEQAALRYLQQAEETYERYVVEQQQQQGGGGGGGQSAAAEDLADLFELELDKLKNQYETVQRGQQQSADETVDEIMEKLQELARRQEQEAERQRRRAQQANQGAPPGGGASQRDLAEEVEETARQLERLAREQNNAELQETARQLEQAAENMRRSAAESGSSGSSEAQAALDRLEEARRRLQDNREDRARRDAEDALRQVADLTRQQRDVQRDVRELPASGQERADQLRQLIERKNQMTEAVQNLERQLDRAARDAQADNPESARNLKAAADEIRESKLKEKIQYSRGQIQARDPQTASILEIDIEGDLRNLQEHLEQARDASGQRQADPLEEALEQARDLVRGMEAMDRRLREGTEGQEGQAPEGQQGEAGDPQEGQAGQQESQGQEGQAGQQGQEGGQQQGGNAQGEPGQARDANAGPPSGGATRGNPRALSEEEIRQYTREFGQRADQVRNLRNQLQQAGRPVEDLQAVLEAIARLSRDGTYDNPAVVAGLNEEIVEMLKRLEFGLRREVEGEGERRATLTGSDEVPAGYRALVEEYYKALARSGRPGGGN